MEGEFAAGVAERIQHKLDTFINTSINITLSGKQYERGENY